MRNTHTLLSKCNSRSDVPIASEAGLQKQLEVVMHGRGGPAAFMFGTTCSGRAAKVTGRFWRVRARVKACGWRRHHLSALYTITGTSLLLDYTSYDQWQTPPIPFMHSSIHDTPTHAAVVYKYACDVPVNLRGQDHWPPKNAELPTPRQTSLPD
jgi:hypothetical protein